MQTEVLETSHVDLSTPRRFTSHSPEETAKAAKVLTRELHSGDVIAFTGDLGSGKTTFIRALCGHLGVHEEEITSPSFTLINEYHGRYPIYHFDLYRIESPEEAFALGLDEYLAMDGICLIEWAERIIDYLPERRFEVRISHVDPEHPNWREIELEIRENPDH